MTVTGRRALIGAAAIILAGCLELGGKIPGVASISDLTLPYPSVVIGDVLRDSLGAPSPVSITAFGAAGDTIRNEPVTFIALDTTLKVDADGTVHGLFRDSIGGRIVAGAGGLQTPFKRIIVTIAPTTTTKSADPTSITFDPITPDTSIKSNWSQPLTLTLTGAASQPAQGYVVVYSLVETPDPEVPGTPTAYIANDNGATMLRDSTDTRGVASRIVVLRQSAIASSIRSGVRPDTIIVRATVKYLGADVPGSPVQFVVPVAKKP